MAGAVVVFCLIHDHRRAAHSRISEYVGYVYGFGREAPEHGTLGAALEPMGLVRWYRDLVARMHDVFLQHYCQPGGSVSLQLSGGVVGKTYARGCPYPFAQFVKFVARTAPAPQCVPRNGQFAVATVLG